MEKTIINEILTYWFGPLDSEGLSAPEQHGLWFKSSAATDKACGELFRSAVELAIAGKLDHWAKSDRGLIALILLLDQFPRNIYRGTPSSFSGDGKSLVVARQAIATNRHQDAPLIHRVFLYLPLEHSEDLAVQEQCVALFEELVSTTGLEQMTGFSRYAVAHRDVIAQFGRFPHRNAILGRQSTDAEIEHIATHGGF
jgi:uncharacterized protein (DUF924 family)